MSNQFFLDENDIDMLTNLLLSSQQLGRREALCTRIGVNPNRLTFIRDSSDYDFCLLLIQHLNEIGQQEALCKLCCKELPSIFRYGKHASTLNQIAIKLNCNQRSDQQQTVLSPNPPPSSNINPFIRLIQNKLVLVSVFFLIGLVGFVWLYQTNPTSTSSLLKNLEEGSIISLECRGTDKAGFRWLSSQLDNKRVILASSPNLFTRWKIHFVDRDEVKVALEAQKPTNNLKWLVGRIEDKSVGLAPQIDSTLRGTIWKVNIFRDGEIALDNQGEPKLFLNGQTQNSSIDLVDSTDSTIYSGTKWKIKIEN